MKFKKPDLLFLLLVFSILFSLTSEAKRRRHVKLEKNRCAEIVYESSRKNPRRHVAPKWSPDPWGQLKQIRVLTLNVYNIYHQLGRAAYQADGEFKELVPARDKSPEIVKQKAAVILDLMPDFAVIQEIEVGRYRSAVETLETFARESLGGRYVVKMAPTTNDPKGNAIGFLVKKDLAEDYEFKVLSHVDRRTNLIMDLKGESKTIFTRDFPALLVRKKGDAQPLFAIFGVHLKSKRAANRRAAKRTTEQRAQREIDEMVRIVRKFQKEYPGTPYIVSGDFNRDISTAPELGPLRAKLGLKEGMLSLARKVSTTARTTAFFFNPRTGAKDSVQYDGNWLSHHLQKFAKDSWVYHFRSEIGDVLPEPETYAQREELPSDHYPVVVDISTEAW